jgi:hypothetical protein
MSKFQFTSPNGKVFEIEGPSGATVEQARRVFEEQLNTGSLVGLKPGDVVSAATQAAAGLKSALGQLGSALPTLPKLDLSGAIPTDLIDAAKFIQQGTPSISIGPISTTQLQGIMTEAANYVGQAANTISAAGIGKFGFSVDQLELQGITKPGVADALKSAGTPTVTQADVAEANKINAEGGSTTPEQVAQNRQLNSFLTPAAFTGKLGVSSVENLLTDERLQNTLEEGLLKNSYDQLNKLGITQAIGDVKDLAATVQTATKFGVDAAASLVKGLPIPNIAAEIKSLSAATEFATSFADKFGEKLASGSPLDSGIKRAVGFSKTINRDTVNAAVTSILGNAKIPTPNFSPAAPGAVGAAESGLYSNTKDEDLTYTGTDHIVWDRINAERLRRGVGPLPNPRPPETD